MAIERRGQRLVIAGASSLLGGDVKTLLEESRFAGWDFRLVDEEDAAGTLTEAAGEATLIQPIEEDTFRGARLVFLTGSPEFAKRCLAPARESGATVLDFSRGTAGEADARPWFPGIERLAGKPVDKNAKLFTVLSAAGTAIAALALALRAAGLRSLVAVTFQSVSEAGRSGIEELETQTSQLLSFQSVGQQVFDAQTAFNLLPRYGAESRQDLQRTMRLIREEVTAGVGDASVDSKIALNLVHAPVFYGMVFSAYVALDGNSDAATLKKLCSDAGFLFVANEEAAPSNVSVGGETAIFLREPAPDPGQKGSWWFWGVADNLRFPAASGRRLAELLES